MALIQAYVDDSGCKGQGEVFVFSALISASSIWTAFSDEWQACLDQSPKIEYFKMDEATGLSGQFRNFTPKQRDERLKRFCKVICGHKMIEFAFISDLVDFQTLWAPRISRPLSEPYFFPFHMTIFGVAYEVLRIGVCQKFEIFFDEQVILGPRAKAWYPLVRTFADNEPIKDLLPVEPFFRSDKDVPPLQAADLTAWMQRNHNEKGLGEFTWLKQELSGLTLSPLSKILDRELIQRIASNSYSEDQILESQKHSLEVYRETFGHDWPPKNKAERKRFHGR